MKKCINATIEAHIRRGAIYLLFLLGVSLIPFALAQRTTGEQSTTAKVAQLPATSSDSGAAAARETLAVLKLPSGGVLWDQYNNPATEPPVAIGSQDFEPTLNTLDDQAADDFVLATPPPGINIYITAVRVLGEYSTGGGPASSFNVYFYSNGAGNLPGTLIGAYLNLSYTGTPTDFRINLPHPVPFGPGTHWVSVQARQDSNTNGQWFWHNRTVQTDAGAAWQNPADGYGTGCITWNRKNACIPDQVWPDQVFQILGFWEGNPPSPTPTATPIACSLFEHFDNVTPPALPAGWMATNPIDPDGILWQTSDSGLPSPAADSPPNAAWVNDPAMISDKHLDSPPIAIDSLTTAILTFRNNYALQNAFDGGVLEISIDGGAFQDILAAGGSFLQGGYNGTISTCCGNPLAGRQAWTGSSGGFIPTAVGMPSGHTSVLRWRMGSDSSTSGQGWRIDSVQIICERPTPTATATAAHTPTPTATATFTRTPTATPTVSATPTATLPPSATPTVTPGVTATPSDPGGTATSTPTASATATRVTPTPRPHPSPAPRP
jgi:hypothetical protein